MFKHKSSKPTKFKVGELVKVLSREDIFNTIDSGKATEGLRLTEQMLVYCGNKYKILKVISSFYNERKRRTVKPKKPLYILEDVICNGEVNSFDIKCDHCCYLLWHEDWLGHID